MFLARSIMVLSKWMTSLAPVRCQRELRASKQVARMISRRASRRIFVRTFESAQLEPHQPRTKIVASLLSRRNSVCRLCVSSIHDQSHRNIHSDVNRNLDIAHPTRQDKTRRNSDCLRNSARSISAPCDSLLILRRLTEQNDDEDRSVSRETSRLIIGLAPHSRQPNCARLNATTTTRYFKASSRLASRISEASGPERATRVDSQYNERARCQFLGVASENRYVIFISIVVVVSGKLI